MRVKELALLDIKLYDLHQIKDHIINMEWDRKIWYYRYDGGGKVRMLINESGVLKDIRKWIKLWPGSKDSCTVWRGYADNTVCCKYLLSE